MAPALSLGAGLLVEKGGRWVGQEQPVLLAGVWLWDRRAEVWVLLFANWVCPEDTWHCSEA